MRIGIDITSALTQGGGIGRYTRELVTAVTRPGKRDDGLRYQLFSAKKPEKSPVPFVMPAGTNTTYREIPIDEKWLYRLWYRLRVPLPVQWFSGRVDVFHSPDFVLPPVSGHIPTLLTVHDLSFVHYPDTFTDVLVSYLNRVVPWSVGRATHILADSEATKRDLLDLWQVPNEKVTVLYPAVGKAFRPVTKKPHLEAVRRKYKLGNAPFLFTISTIHPRKNYKMLIRAYAKIAQDWSHNLIIAGGKGWLYEDVFAEVERLGLSGRVKFIGYVHDNDLPAIYSQATLFVFPSLYEGFGFPPLEAMSCGVPVLTSNASSLPEVVASAGVQLSPHDEKEWTETIHRLLLDAEKRSQMVAQGFLQARKFRWKQAAQQLREVYRGLLRED